MHYYLTPDTELLWGLTKMLADKEVKTGFKSVCLNNTTYILCISISFVP